MTEIEKAEEYANKQHTHVILQWEKIKQAYLAGLHEGQPKWHDLRKDPNDLPKDNKCEYLVFLDWLGKKYELLRLCEIKTLKDTVIAWCEIPQFKE